MTSLFTEWPCNKMFPTLDTRNGGEQMNTFGIIGLAALTLMSIVPMAKPVPPTLHTQAFSNQLPLTVSFACADFGGNRNIGTFTVDVSGRDPGSTFISWNFFSNGPISGVEIFLYGPNTDEATICNGNVNTAIAIATTQTLSARILSSGRYALVGTASCSLNCGPYSTTVSETWTVTTLS